METYYDGFFSGLDVYTSIDSPHVTSQMDLYNVHEMGVMNYMQYELPHLHHISQEPENSLSGMDYNFHEMDNVQYDFSPLAEISQEPPNFQQSAFVAYRKVSLDVNVGSHKSGQILHKRCFILLRKIDESRKLARRISSSSALPPRKKKRTAVEHTIAERGRRTRIRQHFSNLKSLLPINFKNDRNASRNSILAITTNYLKELKLRVAQLEQQNQTSQTSVIKNISVNGQSHEQSLNLQFKVVYYSSEVTLEQCKENPCLVSIRTSMQCDLLTCPTSVLMKQLQLLREEVEVVSIHANREPFLFCSNILVTSKKQAWDIYMWRNLGIKVRESLFQELS